MYMVADCFSRSYGYKYKSFDVRIFIKTRKTDIRINYDGKLY